MILVPTRTLSAGAVAQLTQYQNQIDAELVYSARVLLAKQRFKQVNRKSNMTFREIRDTLSQMCSGSRRCMYCEDSASDEVEHYLPKDLYPERVFQWDNYLYACGPCNGPKKNNFAVFDQGGALVEVARARHSPVLPPTPGNPVLLGPRFDDALNYMKLDIAGDTFLFVPIDTNNADEQQRADYTIRILGLNSRDYLPKARREAYANYRAHLLDYVNARNGGGTAVRLGRIRDTVRTMCHPTVWAEMKRQSASIAELALLFGTAPEVLGW